MPPIELDEVPIRIGGPPRAADPSHTRSRKVLSRSPTLRVGSAASHPTRRVGLRNSTTGNVYQGYGQLARRPGAAGRGSP